MSYMSANNVMKKEKKKEMKEFKDLFNNLACRNIMIAGAFRSFGNMAVSCYIPVFFQKIYPQFTS